jgi:hypothetical protein
MGDMLPNAEILGNDLSPIQPMWYAQEYVDERKGRGRSGQKGGRGLIIVADLCDGE